MSQRKKCNDVTPQTIKSSSEDREQPKRIHLTLVTEEEREKYRVPSYDYLLDGLLLLFSFCAYA